MESINCIAKIKEFEFESIEPVTLELEKKQGEYITIWGRKLYNPAHWVITAVFIENSRYISPSMIINISKHGYKQIKNLKL